MAALVSTNRSGRPNPKISAAQLACPNEPVPKGTRVKASFSPGRRRFEERVAYGHGSRAATSPLRYSYPHDNCKATRGT